MANVSVPQRSSSSEFVQGSPEGASSQDRSARGPTEGRSVSSVIVHDILRGLYDGRYEPGQRLIEAQLTSAHGISRGPVREALKTLAAMGVVELANQRSAQVKMLTINEAVDILIVVQALLGTAARIAAQNINSESAREKMEAALEELTNFDPTSENAAFALARNSFYNTLTGIAGNSELRRILPSAQINIIRVQFRSMLRVINASRHSDYCRIAEAVLASKPAAAEAAMRLHIERAIKSLDALRATGPSIR